MPKYNKATSNLYVIKQSNFFFDFFNTRNMKNILKINNSYFISKSRNKGLMKNLQETEANNYRKRGIRNT